MKRLDVSNFLKYLTIIFFLSKSSINKVPAEKLIHANRMDKGEGRESYIDVVKNIQNLYLKSS